jgi:hypothetical protein
MPYEDEYEKGDRYNKADGFGHCAYIGTDIYSVGDEDDRDGGVENSDAIVVFNDGR